MQHHTQPDPLATESFPTDPTGLPEAGRPEQLELAPGDTLDLEVGPVAKRLGEVTVRMLGYNGSIPGPTLKVQQGSEIIVQVTNNGDLDTTVHWHGLRLENKYDGVPHETQAPIPVGGEFTYRIQFPGRRPVLVPPPHPGGLHPGAGPVRQHPGRPAGPRLLAAGRPRAGPDRGRPAGGRGQDRPVQPHRDQLCRHGPLRQRLSDQRRPRAAARGQVRGGGAVVADQHRQHPGVQPDRAGGADEAGRGGQRPGRAPGARRVGGAGPLGAGRGGRAGRAAGGAGAGAPHPRPDLPARHRDRDRGGAGADTSGPAVRAAAPGPGAEAERRQLDRWLAAPPDKVLALVAQMDDPAAMPAGAGPVVYACPMHPEVTGQEPGRCPKCGMKLLATAAPAITYACPMHPEVTSDQPGRCPKCGMKLLVTSSMPQPSAGHDQAAMEDHGGHAGDHDHHHEGDHGAHGGSSGGIEWEDDMVEVNRLTTTATMHWRFLDRTSGTDSPAINWQFTVGERVKIRLVNEMDSDYPMHHPFHLHGAGRFLVLARDGVPEPNLVWKDTVLVRTGQVVDILFDVSNPGLWMAHCHIAEHMQSGMMFSFNVAREAAR